MFTGLTRQEQRALALLLGVIVLGLAIHQWRGHGRRIRIEPAPARHLSTAATRANASAKQASASNPPTSQARIDINTATATQLVALPGIGPVKAESIVQYRTVHGPFRRIEDLQNVRGIGPKTFETLKPLIEVSGSLEQSSAPAANPTSSTVAAEPSVVPAPSPPPARAPVQPGPIDINTATQEQLETLPGIGPVLAGRIIQYRRQHGRFGSVDELLEVKGIGTKRLGELRPLVTCR